MGYGKIYNTTWWGNALDTARTAGTEPDFFGSQMKLLTSNQPELVTNGDFATDSDWNKEAGWSIANGKASCDGSDGTNLNQNGVVENGKTYKISFEILNYVGGFLNGRIGSANSNDFTVNSNGSYSFNLLSDGTNLIFRSSSFTGSIDNVSVKVARLELDQIEAKKCLADWIHVTALQDLNN